MSKRKPELEPCDCLACKLQDAIVERAAEVADDQTMHIDARETLSALLPTIGMLLTGIDYKDAEAWWLAVLSERSAAMLPDNVEFGEAYKGRA